MPATFTDRLAPLVADLGVILREALEGDELGAASDRDLLTGLRALAAAVRQAEAALIAGAGEVAARSASTVKEDRLCARMGSANPTDLLQRVTRFSAATVAGYLRGARAVTRERSMTTRAMA